MKRAGFGNVTFKLRDVLLQPIDENDESFDLVMCDIAEAEKVVPAALKALKKGGFVAGHCLHIEQAKALAVECQKFCHDTHMVEIIARDYEVSERGLRPKHVGLMHTAYLVFARK
jgi:tRNA A58 N-methylase Trm61